MSTGWRQNAWLLPVSAVMVVVLALAIPPHLKYDPAVLNKNSPQLDFRLALIHLTLGSIALVTVCLNIWPWLRIRYPAAHRWVGRVYVFAATPGSLLTIPLVLLNNAWQSDIGALATGGFWFTTILLGYVSIRRRDYVRHRRWMTYSFAMATSFAWGPILGPMFQAPDRFPYLAEAIRWVGPLVNLGVAKWWLDRTAQGSAVVLPFPATVSTPDTAMSSADGAGQTEQRAA
jgi:Predicted membrane protein (DUF2306)